MSEEEKYALCQNCRQNIPESKMFLHEGFCLRNNKFCPECNKVFLVQEFEEHLKTHNEKKSPPPQEKLPPPKIPEKKDAINKDKPSLSEHRKNCQHNKKEPVPKAKPAFERPKIKPRVIDDNLGLKQCEFCVNMVEDLPAHLKECKVKKMIEEENAKYYKDLEKRNREDDLLAQKLGKEKYMDVSKDELMARNLQKDLKPLIDTSKDEQMAKNLQKSFKPLVDTSKDEEMAINLQKQFGTMNDTNNDEKMARELQKQFGNFNVDYNKDEQMAKMLEQQERERMINNNNQYQFNFNRPGPGPAPGQNDVMDEELKRAIEQSKKEFYK